jgi:SagB-type dehydrogenase family enzyme
MPFVRLADDAALVVRDGDGFVLRDEEEVLRLPCGGPALRRVAQFLATPREEHALRHAVPPAAHAMLDSLFAHGAIVPDPGTALLVDLHARTVAGQECLAAPAGADTAFLAREAGTGRLIGLPDVGPGEARLADVLRQRRTAEGFTGGSVPLTAVAAALGAGAGITGSSLLPGAPRAYPSGGALYPVEVHLVATRVGDLDAGIYRYQPVAHGLTLRAPIPTVDELARWLGEHPAADLACLVLLSTDFARPSLSRRYAGKAYRLALLEAGHLAQNLLLVATAFGLGTLPICGFDGESLAAAAELAHPDEVILYVVGLGRTAAR